MPLFKLSFLFCLTCSSILAQQGLVLDSTIRRDFFGIDTLPTQKVIFQYDLTGNTVTEITQNWNPQNQQWLNQSRTTNHYSGNRLDTTTVWTVDSLFNWVPEERTMLTYSDGRLTTLFNQVWKDNRWQNGTRNEFGQDSSGTTTVNYYWDEDTWVISDSTFSLFMDDIQLSAESFEWVDSLNTYQQLSFTLMEYDSVWNLIKRTRSEYSMTSDTYRPRSRDTFAYDINRFQILSRFDVWIGFDSIWEPSFQIDRMPNENGFIGESLVSFANFLNGNLVRTSRIVYSYFDGQNRAETDTLLQTVMSYTYQGPVEVPDYITTYYYSNQQTTTIREQNLADIRIYPNPATQFVNIVKPNLQPLQYRWIALDGKVVAQGISNTQIPTPDAHQAQVFVLQLFDRQKLIHTSPILVKH